MTPRDVTYSTLGTSITAGPEPSAPPPPPPPAPAITLSSLSGSTGTTGVAMNFQAVLSNPGTLPLVGTPVDVVGVADPEPNTVTFELGQLNKAFAATWAAAGEKQLRMEAPSGIVSNTVTVTISDPTPPPPPPSPTTATLSLPSTATTGVAINGTVTLDAPAVSNTACSLAISDGGTLTPPSPVVLAGQTTIGFTASWPAAGAGRTVALNSTSPSLTPAGTPRSVTVSDPPSGPTIGAQIATLALQSEGTALVAAPYSATIFPARGAVPSGSIIASSSDATLRGAILSTWDDGSAAVVVCSGQATVSSGGTASVPVNVATGSAGTALTTAAIAALVSSVAVNFQGSYGIASLTSFGSPERTWWATTGTICCRYRMAAPTPGTTALEAVIDITAWADRALVEVVIENSKFDAAASTTSTKPTAASYTGATVSVNGSTIATVNSSASTPGTHDAFRAWYAAGWVGAGSPALRATQLHTELQQHPLLFKCDQAATFSMATYASDAYAVWGIGRHRASMGATGDDDTLGAIPAWEARALQSGDYRAWKATEASALSILSYTINTRDSVTGAVPHSAVMPNKVQDSFWANWPSNTAGPAFEVAHQPAVGLMAFLSRPSPVFIEIAQKVGTWTATDYGTRDLKNNMDEAAVGIDDCTGIIGNQQIRSKAWGIRNILHPTFITPSSHPWRAGGVEWLDRNVRYLKAYTSNAKFVLNALWEGEPDAPVSLTPGLAGQNSSMWMLHYVIPEIHKLAESQILASISGARQIEADAVADAIALQPVRWINEQPNGGWRFVTYRTRQGSSGSMTSYTDWGAQRAADVTTGAPSATTGQWGGDVVGNETSWAAIEALGFQTTAYQTNTYSALFWNALAAAVERRVSAASGTAATAWETMIAGITNLAAWRVPFGSNPKASAYPRTGLLPAWRQGLTLNQWHVLPNTAVAALTTDVGLVGERIFRNFCGVVQNETHNEYQAFGDGHSGGDGNEVCVIGLEADTPAWSVRSQPTPVGQRVTAPTPPTNENQLWWGTVGSRKPNPPHTYSSGQWVESRNSFMYLGYFGPYNVGGPVDTRVLEFKRGTMTWTQPEDAAYISTGNIARATCKAPDGMIYGSASGQTVYKFDPTQAVGSQFSVLASTGALDWAGYGAYVYDTSRNRIFRIGDAYASVPNRYVTVTVPGGVVTNVASLLSGDAGVLSALNARVQLDTVGACYDAINDRFIVPTGAAGGSFYAINAGTWAVTLESPATSSGSVSQDHNFGGIFGRVHYNAALKCIVYFPNANANLAILPLDN